MLNVTVGGARCRPSTESKVRDEISFFSILTATGFQPFSGELSSGMQWIENERFNPAFVFNARVGFKGKMYIYGVVL